ncbi:MAG TPA: S8 family serine peptidase, partial [Verrucomicrobiae bacterium]|nr:S8 family serine peptidase [Verrucomicrobiae bacterium]
MKTRLTLEKAREFLQGGTGQGIKIAILDSGVDTTHPALANLTLADEVAIIGDGVQLRTVDDRARDVFGHGTAIAAILRSLAPEATLGSFRVLGDQLRSRTAIIQEGVRQALDRGYQILNCSFGCGREDQVLHYKDWIDEAYVRGRHIVAACNNFDHLKREWPGHFPSVITVNFAKGAAPESLFFRPGSLVEFSARGEEIEVPWTGGGYKKVTGSSFAAPHVAGLLARLLSRCPTLPPLE